MAPTVVLYPIDIQGRQLCRYYNVERTLCLHGNGVPVVQEVTVVVSTSSATDIEFAIRLFEVEDFALGVNEKGEVRGATAATPVYRYVDLKGSELANHESDSNHKSLFGPFFLERKKDSNHF